MQATRSMLALAAAFGLIGTAAPVLAQEAEPPATRDASAVSLLEAAAETLSGLESLSVEVKRSMVVTDELAPENAAFATVRLGSRGTMQGARDTDGEWVYRIDGTADDIGKKDAYRISIFREPLTVSWLDHENETLVVARPTLARGTYVASVEGFGPEYLFAEKPFAEELAAPTVRSLGVEELDGEVCEVVEVDYGSGSRTRPHRFYLGAQDRLPRLIVRVMIPGFEEHYRFTAMDTSTAVDRDLIRLVPPAGWATDYRPASLNPAIRPDPSTTLPPSDPGTPGQQREGGEVGDRLAPFVSMTMFGEQISRDDLIGSPTVLVFWSSWVPNAASTVDDIASLHRESAGQAKLVTLTVRERQPDSAYNMLAEAGLDDVTLVTEARDAIVGMNVLRSPVFIVADSEGTIVYRSDRYEPETTLKQVREAIGKLTADGGE